MSVDLEADPSPVVDTPVVEPPAPPLPPEPLPDPDEVGAVEIQGGKHVPLEALKASRAEAKALKEQVALLPALQQKLAQMEGSLQTFQQLQQATRTPPAAAAQPTDNPVLERYARSLDYVDPTTGKPDLARAAAHRELVREEARALAQEMVSPLQQQSARAQSAANYQAVRNIQSPQGVKPSEQQLNWMWQNLPAEYTADPRVAQALAAMAMGVDVLTGTGAKPPSVVAPPGAPPLHTEGAGGGPVRRAATITAAEREVIGQRGMKEETYLKHTKDFVKGRPVSLDED